MNQLYQEGEETKTKGGLGKRNPVGDLQEGILLFKLGTDGGSAVGLVAKKETVTKMHNQGRT